MSKLNRDYKTLMRAFLALYGQTLAAVMRAVRVCAAPLASNETLDQQQLFIEGKLRKKGAVRDFKQTVFQERGPKNPGGQACEGQSCLAR